MAERDRIDLSKLSAEQIRQLEDTLTSMIASAKSRPSEERPIAGGGGHSSHVAAA